MHTQLLCSQSIATMGLPKISDALPGTEVTVPISIDTINNLIVGIQISIEHDPSVLTPVSWQNIHSNFQASPWEILPWPNPGEYNIAWIDESFVGQSILPGETLIEIVFTYHGGYSDLIFGSTEEINSFQEKEITIILDPAYHLFNLTALNGYVCQSCASAIWNGNVSSDWFYALNWNVGIVPNSTDDVHIPAGMPNDPLIDGGLVAEVNSLTVDSGVSLILGSEGYLTVSGNTFFNGNMIIFSDASGKGGSFIGTIDEASTGYFSYNREILATSPYGGLGGWHYISSPISTFNSDQIWDYYLNYYDEPSSMWVHHESLDPGICIPAPNMAMGAMEGWSVKFSEDYGYCGGGTGTTVEFMGPITALYDEPQTYNGTASDPTGGYFSNWNLIGNPYPATWYYEAMWGGAGLPLGWDDAMYMWDDATQQYLSWVQGIGNANDGYVVPTQAVFFHGNGLETTMPLSMSPSELHHTNYQFTKREENEILRLKVTGEFSQDETFIRFMDEATEGFDGSYDAYKLISGADNVPAIFTHAGDVILSINSLPATDLVKMSFNCSQSGAFTIEATETSDFSYVVLEDTFTGELTDLLCDSHTFYYSNRDYPNRFIVHFSPFNDEANNSKSISVHTHEYNIYVKVLKQITGEIIVFNMMGQEVASADFRRGLNILPISETNACFIVKVVSSSDIVTKKVYIR
jgi:hypothetical protein